MYLGKAWFTWTSTSDVYSNPCLVEITHFNSFGQQSFCPQSDMICVKGLNHGQVHMHVIKCKLNFLHLIDPLHIIYFVHTLSGWYQSLKYDYASMVDSHHLLNNYIATIKISRLSFHSVTPPFMFKHLTHPVALVICY